MYRVHILLKMDNVAFFKNGGWILGIWSAANDLEPSEHGLKDYVSLKVSITAVLETVFLGKYCA